ncbi:Lrp/AsnC family transcriptional regulator, partial [Prauserella cavernicola]
MTDADEIDRRLITLLREDGRRTYSDRAGIVGLSVAAVKRRVNRLQAIGVITGFTVQDDHTKLGWG